jgi:type IV secretory pathway protease TraF
MPITKPWTPDEVAKLAALAEKGVSLMRASAALGGKTSAVQKKAREIGRPLAGVRKIIEGLRANGVIDIRQK